MNLAEHRDYFERRHAECLAKADSVNDPAIASLHRAFATHYAQTMAAPDPARLRDLQPQG